ALAEQPREISRRAERRRGADERQTRGREGVAVGTRPQEEASAATGRGAGRRGEPGDPFPARATMPPRTQVGNSNRDEAAMTGRGRRPPATPRAAPPLLHAGEEDRRGRGYRTTDPAGAPAIVDGSACSGSGARDGKFRSISRHCRTASRHFENASSPRASPSRWMSTRPVARSTSRTCASNEGDVWRA